jgi:hypothetical protein
MKVASNTPITLSRRDWYARTTNTDCGSTWAKTFHTDYAISFKDPWDASTSKAGRDRPDVEETIRSLEVPFSELNRSVYQVWLREPYRQDHYACRISALRQLKKEAQQTVAELKTADEAATRLLGGLDTLSPAELERRKFVLFALSSNKAFTADAMQLTRETLIEREADELVETFEYEFSRITDGASWSYHFEPGLWHPNTLTGHDPQELYEDERCAHERAVIALVQSKLSKRGVRVLDIEQGEAQRKGTKPLEEDSPITEFGSLKTGY